MPSLCPLPADTNFFHAASARAVAEEDYDALMDGAARFLPTLGAQVNFFSTLRLPDSVLATLMSPRLHGAGK